jgi:hypothetical protein
MPTIKAAALTPGQELDIAGQRYVVDVVKVKKKGVRLAITGGVDNRTFDRVVDAGREFEVTSKPKASASAEAFSVADAPSKAEKRIRRTLDAVPLADQRADGTWVIPFPITDANVAAHLLAFHGARWDGVGVEEAKRLIPDAERTMTADAAVVEASWRRALEIHTDHHARIDAGEVVVGVVPHVHEGEGR